MNPGSPPPPQVAPFPAAEPTDLVALLHRRGQRATPQRSVILRELRRRARHVTADELRRAVGEELPGTSMPTVYATLELLVELGLVRRIDTGRGAALYDARTEPHQHIVCRRCGRVEDLDGPLDTGGLSRAARAAGFSVDAAELVLSGLCADCGRALEAPMSSPPRRRSAPPRAWRAVSETRRG